MSMSLHLWKSELSLPENSRLSCTSPPPTMAKTSVQAVVMAFSTSKMEASRSTGTISSPPMPPWALHHSANATPESHSSLSSPGRIWDRRSLPTPM